MAVFAVTEELDQTPRKSSASSGSEAGQDRLTSGADFEEPTIVLEKLVSRIRALANTHNLLTTQNWRPTRFSDILYPELNAVYGAERVELHGPDVRLNARATVALGITIHELATNAAKYGALSNESGKLSVRWSRVDEGDGEKLVIRWAESGGPPVVSPESKGFGSELVRATVEGSLQGEVIQDFEPTGMHCVIQLPAEFAMGTEQDENEITGPVDA